ncbi:hypothetical protein TKK_0010342 [Trichogramma kaykai]
MMKDKTFFGRRVNFFIIALQRRDFSVVKYFQEYVKLKIHEVRFKDGRCALHYLLKEDDYSMEYDVSGKLIKEVGDYFLEDSVENHQDAHGYTYFHAACMTGNVAAIDRFLSQGVDVNLSTYTCSPLHIAVQYKQTDAVKILLEKGADPNGLESNNQSTPLHALARPRCLCECPHYCRSCDYKKPADELVALLIVRGTDIEVRDSHGDTPLQVAVSCFDLELTRALLKLGASLSSLNERRMFVMRFESHAFRYNDLNLRIIDMMELLQVAGYKVDFYTRFRMMKCWMRVKRKEADYLMPDLGN